VWEYDEVEDALFAIINVEPLEVQTCQRVENLKKKRMYIVGEQV